MSHEISKRSETNALVLFGATGDLAQRMLLPSLYALHCDGLLSSKFQVFATARSALNDEGFRQLARESLHRFLAKPRLNVDTVEGFLSRLRYTPLDLAKSHEFRALAEMLPAPGGNRIAVF